MLAGLTGPATFSVTTAVVGVLFALLALGLSQGPGWRELRWFAACALLAALYSACNAVVTLDVPDEMLVWASRLSLLMGGLNGAAWFVYFAEQHGRRLHRLERWFVASSTAFAFLSLVPRVIVTDTVAARPIGWMGTTYRDALPTTLGQLCYGFYCLGLLILAARYARQWRRRERTAAAHCTGLVALFASAVNDSLAAAGVLRMPYLIDLGFLVLVLAVGGSLASRFVADARALERSSADLRATQAELVKRERLAALGELSAVVAHEVRNPVGVIFNALTTLRRALGPTPPQAETLLGIVGEEAERLKRMVAELLQFARPMDVRLGEVALGPLVAGAVEAARSAAGDAGPIDLSIEIDASATSSRDADALFACDGELVRQAVINLVTNALQAPGRRGPVRVRISGGTDRRALIEVIDDGAGVPEELVDRIFEPFFTTRPTGTGLGLSVVQRIAEAHGGELSHRATTGGGATFVLSVPEGGARASG